MTHFLTTITETAEDGELLNLLAHLHGYLAQHQTAKGFVWPPQAWWEVLQLPAHIQAGPLVHRYRMPMLTAPQISPLTDQRAMTVFERKNEWLRVYPGPDQLGAAQWVLATECVP